MNQQKFSDIAIVGISCAFPGAKDKNAYWDLIAQNQCATDLPPSRVKRGYIASEGVIDDAYFFDACYFNLSPRDAKLMDPQLRKLLEHSALALYDANVTEQEDSNAIGTFLSVGTNQYYSKNLVPSDYFDDTNLQHSLTIGNSHHCVATQVAYQLNLHGPAVTLSTACSSSLVSIYMACRSLLNNESSIALAGGACINTPQGEGYMYVPGGILSETGRCQPFSKQSDGTVPSSGVGIVVLKKLSDAIDAQDAIYAVIKGGAINNDGARKVGYTAPSIEGQSNAIQMALNASGLSTDEIEFIECHGTATALGDPIEVDALRGVYELEQRSIALGSVKWNIGHTDAAAGVASLIKAALSVKYNVIVGSPYLKEYNPELDMEDSSFYVPFENHVYSKKRPTAAVSSFGMGGTNCHMIVSAFSKHTNAEGVDDASQDSPINHSLDFAGEPFLIPYSSRSVVSLQALEEQMGLWLRKHSKTSMVDVVGTLIQCRLKEPVRSCYLASNKAELLQALSNSDSKFNSVISGVEAILVIEGQGSQFKGAASQYYQQLPLFRQHFDHCMELFSEQANMPKDLRVVALESDFPEDITKLQTLYAQPILFAIQYSLAKCLQQRGVSFQSYLGHSLGEWIAASIAGLWSLPDAIRLIANRAVSMQQCKDGSMLAVFESEENVRAALTGSITIAAINGEKLTVIAGHTDDVNHAAKEFLKQGVKVKKLITNKAFHNPLILDAIEPLREMLKSVPFHKVQGSLYSNLTGKKKPFRKLRDPDYWLQQLQEPVQMSACVDSIRAEKALLVDLGVSSAMNNMIVSHQVGLYERVISSRTYLQQEHGLAKLLAHLWTLGIDINWEYALPKSWSKINLPGYVFEQAEYFYKPENLKRGVNSKQPVKNWLYQDTWSIEPLVLPKIEQPQVIDRLENWFKRGSHYFYTGFANLSEIYPGLLARFFQDIKQLKFSSNMMCYVFIQSMAMPFAQTLSQCYRNALSALFHALRQENPNITIKLISYCEELQDLLCYDYGLLNSTANAIHFDGQYIWRKNFLEVSAEQTQFFHWPEQGYIIITGGLGKVGLELANYILNQTSLTVVLTGRKSTDFPAVPLKELSSQQLNTIENKTAFECIKNSGRAYYASACVTQVEQWENLAQALNAQFGDWVGIVHCAAYTAVEGLTPVLSANSEVIERHYSAKVTGVQSIDQLCAKYEPQFCILMSSISTLLGGYGLGVYAYVNQFMNEFARTRQNSVTKWLSVSWDGWDLQDDPDLADSIKSLAINQEDSDEVFKLMFQHIDLNHFVVSTHDLSTRLAQWVTNVTKQQNQRGVFDRQRVTQQVKDIFCQILEVEKVEDQTNFFELGGESVMFTSLISKVKSVLGVALPLHEFIDNPCVENVVDISAKEFGISHLNRTYVKDVLTNIWRELLDIEEITEESNFFDCGGDSLIFTQLAKRVNDELLFSLPLHRFIDQPTIGHIINLISAVDSSDAEQIYDDLVLPEDLSPIKASHDSSETVFLVTGAAGLLGVNLIISLLKKEQVQRVIALVRAKDSAVAYQRVSQQIERFAPDIDLSRLKVVSGDVSKPHFGLEFESYNELCEQVSDVIHNAANVNHILDYRSLKRTNTESIVDLLRMASCGRQKNIHFVSTLACAFELNKEHRFVEKLPTLDNRPGTTANGYARSKWAAEVLLQQAQQLGYSINVVRPSSIVGHSNDGTFNAQNDHLWLFVKGCLQLGFYPEFDNEINITPVDFMAELIVAISLRNENQVYNVPNPNVAQMNDVFELAISRGLNVKAIDFERWRNEELARVDKENSLYPILAYYTQSESDGVVNQDSTTEPIYKDIPHDFPNVVFDNTQTFLDSNMLRFPEPEVFLNNLMDFLERDGFFSA